MSVSRIYVLLIICENNIIKIEYYTQIIRLFVLKLKLAYRVFVYASYAVQSETGCGLCGRIHTLYRVILAVDYVEGFVRCTE